MVETQGGGLSNSSGGGDSSRVHADLAAAHDALDFLQSQHLAVVGWGRQLVESGVRCTYTGTTTGSSSVSYQVRPIASGSSFATSGSRPRTCGFRNASNEDNMTSWPQRMLPEGAAGQLSLVCACFILCRVTPL